MLIYTKSLYQTFPNKHLFRTFKHFLVTEKVYTHFLQNVRHLNHYIQLSKPYVEGWVDRAFTWAKTPQQYAFWFKIDRRWRTTVRKQTEYRNKIIYG